MRATSTVSLLALFLLLSATIVVGCASNSGLAESAADSAMSDAGYGNATFKSSDEVTTEDSENHQMIAKMRLLGEGMSPNLDDYDFVELVKMDLDGEQVNVVVVSENGKQTALLPENLGQTE